MDQNEIAQRLEQVRERIRRQLDADTSIRIAAALPLEQSLELGEGESAFELPQDPTLNSTPFLERANEQAVITGPTSIGSRVPLLGPILTLMRRLARPFVQPLIDPYLDRQERFNVEVVRHLNELGQRTERRLGRIGEEIQRCIADPTRLEARLEAALSDYDEALRSRHVVLFDALEEELWALRDRLVDAHGEINRRFHEFDVRFVERAQAVDRRFDEKDRAVDQALEEVVRVRGSGGSIGTTELLETREHLTRVLEEIHKRVPQAGSTTTTGAGAAVGGLDAELWQRLRAWMNDADYRAFQDQFRGDTREIVRRMRSHVTRFEGVEGPIADLGCGRGEFLELLQEAGHEAIGVEINIAEVENCTARGLTVVQADLFDWLEGRGPESLGGIFLAQVIEHLAPPDWSRLVRLAASKLAPGGRLLIETINPESLYALVRAYAIDPTHVRPVHPELLAFFANRAGFGSVEIRYQAEVPDNLRVTPIDESSSRGNPELMAVVRALNERLHRIDRLCCAPQEYALVATRTGGTAARS